MANITDQFADPHFRAAVREVLAKGPDDTIYDTDNFASVDELDVSEQNIASLAGLEYFTSLRELYCYGNQLTSLPPLPATLRYLHCGDNQLTSLPPLPATLEELYCDNNQLTSLPPLPASLKELDCTDNQLMSLPPLPASLTILNCADNQLTRIALNGNADYRRIDVRGNCLKSTADITGQSISWGWGWSWGKGKFHFNPQKTP